MGTLSGSGLIFMVCVGLAFYLVWRRWRRRGSSQWIEAEIYAADVLDESSAQASYAQARQPLGQPLTAASPAGPSSAAKPSLPAQARPAPAAGHLRWGRIGLLGLSLLALLASPVLGGLALMQGANPVPALVCLLLAFAGLACLRALALRDQRKRRARRAQTEGLREEGGAPVFSGQQPVSAAQAAPAEASVSEAERGPAQATQPAPTGPIDLNQALERRRKH